MRARQWQVADYGSGFFVNVLDEHGGRVAWQVTREHAELIVRAVAALPDEPDWPLDELDVESDADDALAPG